MSRVTTSEGDRLTDCLTRLLASYPGHVLQLLALLRFGDHLIGWMNGIDGPLKGPNRRGWVRPTAIAV